MKLIYLTLLSIFVLVFCQTAIAQETKKIVEPEYLGIVALIDSAIGNLILLERKTPEQKIKVKAMGFAGGEGYLQIEGEQSPIRFKTDQKLEFVVRVSSQQIDPVSSIQFFRFESKKGKRRMILVKVGAMAISSKSTASQSAVSFDAAKYGESSFRFSAASPLLPGEYCLSAAGTNDAFCFGIDQIQ